MDRFAGQVGADSLQNGEIVGHQIEPLEAVVEPILLRLGPTASVIGS